MVLRSVRGIEVSEETLSVDAIKQVALDPGHYLGHPQTLALMETEYLYPSLGDRTPHGAWIEEGSKDMLERAHDRVVEVLSSHYPNYLGREIDEAVRARFPIALEPAAIQPGNGRW